MASRASDPAIGYLESCFASDDVIERVAVRAVEMKYLTRHDTSPPQTEGGASARLSRSGPRLRF
jgi:hypothetical protein